MPLLVCANIAVLNVLCVWLLLSGRAGAETIQLLHPGLGNCRYNKYAPVV